MASKGRSGQLLHKKPTIAKIKKHNATQIKVNFQEVLLWLSIAGCSSPESSFLHDGQAQVEGGVVMLLFLERTTKDLTQPKVEMQSREGSLAAALEVVAFLGFGPA